MQVKMEWKILHLVKASTVFIGFNQMACLKGVVAPKNVYREPKNQK